MQGTCTLIKLAVSSQLNQVKVLSEEGVHLAEAIQQVEENLSCTDIFSGLHSQYSQIKYFKEKFNLIMPVKIQLPSIPTDYCRLKTNQELEIKVNYSVYVPILEQLEHILNVHEIWEEIKKTKQSDPDLISSYEDGSNYRLSAFFQLHPDAVQVHLYLDEVQLCNSLSSYDHKVVFVYFSLGNLHPKYRSTFKSIYLASIFYNYQVKLYDINLLLKPIIDDLKKLEAGVTIIISGKVTVCFGTLTAVVADNLAMHEVGGLKCSFGRNVMRKCRTCLATEDEIQSLFSDCDFVPRTRESHDKHCASLAVEELKKHFSFLYGVNRNSILNELQHFHVIGGLAPDIMHDILEGTLPKIVALLLSHYLKKKLFTLSELNHIMKNFKYGIHEVKDKPSKMLKDHLKRSSTKGSATQKWLFAVNLGLFVGARVGKNSKHWLCFTILLRICRFVFSQSISRINVFKLGDAVSEFLTAAKSLGVVITSKMHHMSHYTKWLLALGPLSAVGCMRYEAKHSFFKSQQKRIGNWISPPWTLALRHQEWMCQQFLASTENSFMQPELVLSKKCDLLSVDSLSCGGQVAALLDIPLSSLVKCYNGIQINSIRFVANHSVLLCPLQGANPSEFGLLKHIFVSEKRSVYFICELLRSLHFDTHFQAFKVAERPYPFLIVLSPSQLVEFNVYCCHVPSFVLPIDLSRRQIVRYVPRTHSRTNSRAFHAADVDFTIKHVPYRYIVTKTHIEGVACDRSTL